MSAHRNRSRLLLFVFFTISFTSGDVGNVSDPESADRRGQVPVFKPAVPPPGVSLLSSFPEDLEISDYCAELLRVFGRRYVAYVTCVVPAARPVKVCQNCFSRFDSLSEAYRNISADEEGPGNVSCSGSLLRSDRLMLVDALFTSQKDLWAKAACSNCLSGGAQSLSGDTLYFMAVLNGTLACFRSHQQNRTELCRTCKESYGELSELYGRMERNATLCIDIEDSMNTTRRLWSKTFNCSVPREETVPVLAVSSFMLFLPVIFYLSSFLHSEQKKRKLIHPKRAKSYASMPNIQVKQS